MTHTGTSLALFGSEVRRQMRDPAPILTLVGHPESDDVLYPYLIMKSINQWKTKAPGVMAHTASSLTLFGHPESDESHRIRSSLTLI